MAREDRSPQRPRLCDGWPHQRRRRCPSPARPTLNPAGLLRMADVSFMECENASYV